MCDMVGPARHGPNAARPTTRRPDEEAFAPNLVTSGVLLDISSSTEPLVTNLAEVGGDSPPAALVVPCGRLSRWISWMDSRFAGLESMLGCTAPGPAACP